MSEGQAYSTSAVEELKTEMARAAITSRFAEIGWRGTADEGFSSDGWHPNLPPVSGPTGTLTLRLRAEAYVEAGLVPDGAVLLRGETDELGTTYHIYELDPWAAIYEPWIDRINTAFQGWESLPDPADYQGPVESVQAAVTALTPLPTGASGPFGDDFASVDLAANLAVLDGFIGPDGTDTSALLLSFDNAYGAGRIAPLMGNQAQVAVVLGVTLLGEQKLWEAARGDIMTLAQEAHAAFVAGGVASGSISLKVLKAFVGLLGIFMPPPVKAVLTVANGGLSMVESLMPSEESGGAEPNITGSTVEEIYLSTCEAIEKLSSTIYDKEFELLSTTLGGMLDVMATGPGSQFHIHPSAGTAPDLAGVTAINHPAGHLRTIAYEIVPEIAAVMGKAAEQAAAADKRFIWERKVGIGFGSCGPYTRWAAVQAQFDAVTTGSAAELVEAGRLLAVGAGNLEDTDGDARAALKGVEDELARGRFGWNPDDVNPAPGGPPSSQPV
jgi:hypothetical protein